MKQSIDVFNKNLLKKFKKGHEIFGLQKDSSCLFLYSALEFFDSSLFLEFNNTKNAEDYYNHCFDFKNNFFLYYPKKDTLGVVPGFFSENERYRKETILSLYDKKTKFVCIGTKKSFSFSDIPKRTKTSITRISFKLGQTVEQDFVLSFLKNWQYKKVNTVIQPGSYAQRGEVLDVFPPHIQNPIRVLFNFDKIEKISLYNPITQRSIKKLNHINISDTNLGTQNIDNISLKSAFPNNVVVQVVLKNHEYGFYINNQLSSINVSSKKFFNNNVSNKEKTLKLKKSLRLSDSVFFLGNEKNKNALPKSKKIQWLPFNIKHSFLITKKNTLVVSVNEILNKKQHNTKWEPSYITKKNKLTSGNISGLSVGDFIVHRSFGIGVYRGMILKKSNKNTKESLEIEYKNNSRVSVSIDKLNLVHRYVGSLSNPKISALGSKKWVSELKKTKKAVSLVASELLNLYTKKEKKRSFKYLKENDLNSSLKNSFPFVETPDQKQAINDVFYDMNSNKPMDRLICGDVGFGKTEVALRAIFKSTLSNKQTLFLCPTTILADQHFISCKDRLEPLGVVVFLLSRFKTPAEQKKIINKVKTNKVDVLIGTHRVLSKDVCFPNLGLLIVDEEHRFGVTHKEKIQTIKKGVDVLTLTATPIPRTLQQSLVGVRSVSLIQTPPRSRKPIETTVRFFDWKVAFLYINRELERGGQVFFLQNDIKSIFLYKQKIQKHFPSYSIESLHGQMPTIEMEEKLLSFFNGTIDVLVCTTIIESGLDITNANCIIINNAQNFGLSQLYQIRGRVGRGKKQAHCLLFVPNIKIKNQAKERLKSLEKLTALGSGYDISLKDLEIRGAGSLFGYKQSGHISNVGFEIYCELLKTELSKTKNKKVSFVEKPTVLYFKNSFFNKKYIKSVSQRLFFYNKIANALSFSELNEIKNEIFDRFGSLKKQSKNIFFLSKIKIIYTNTNISKINIKKNETILTFENPNDEKKTLFLLNRLSDFKKREQCQVNYTLSTDQQLVFSVSKFKKRKKTLLKLGRLFSINTHM